MRPEYDWDPVKAESNLAKHGVSFDEARTVFDDPLLVSVFDSEHAECEGRWLATGVSAAGRLLTVWYTERGATTRTIGCRCASNREGRDHDEASRR
ncbi:MAG: BrnT family toxin [Armatimonadetes bacterium]|nr:BrnT family toxin [Armatimonadota bacterium]